MLGENEMVSALNSDKPMPIPTAEEKAISTMGKTRVRDRGTRRALATNSVQAARAHAGRGNEPWTTGDSDILVAVMELLDRVAEGE